MTGFRKKVKIVGTLLLAALVLGVVLTPVWFRWLLPVAGRYLGLRYSDYEMQSYGRFLLKGVTYADSSVIFTANRIEAFIPTVYLWNRYVSRDPAPSARVSSWNLKIREQPADRPSVPVYRQFANVGSIISTLHTLIPKAQLSNGVIHVWDEKVFVPNAFWRSTGLTSAIQLPKYHLAGNLQARLAGPQPYQIQLNSTPLSLQTLVEIVQDASSLRFRVTGAWLTNRFEGGAVFRPGEQLPDRARLNCSSFRVPAHFLNLPQFEDVQGALHLSWLTNQFQVQLDASAQPATNWYSEPFSLSLHASGDTNSVLVDRAEISAPWLHAALAQQTAITFTPPYLSAPTSLKLLLNLNEQPWLPARGVMEGQATFSPGTNKLPHATFNLAGKGLAHSNLVVETLALQGDFAWPWLTLSKLQAELPQNSLLTAQARLDVQHQQFENARLHYEGRYGEEFFPQGYSWGKAILALQLAGPFHSLKHSGQLAVESFKPPGLRPLKLLANWTGDQTRLTSVQASVHSGDSGLTAEGSAELGAAENRVRLSRLDLTTSNQKLLTLQRPVQVVTSSARDALGTWHVAVDSFEWAGPAGQLQFSANIAWPLTGKINVSAGNLPLDWLGGFVILPAEQLTIEKLRLSAAWNQGPVEYALAFGASGVLPEKTPFSASGDLKGDDQGVSVEKLSVLSHNKPAIVASGSIPVVVNTTQPLVQMRPEQPISFTAETEPEADFWNIIARRAGVLLRAPRLQLTISGSPAKPEGVIDLQVKQVQISAKTNLPPVQNIRLKATLDQGAVVLNELKLSLLGQPASVTARLPLEEQFWTDLFRGQPQLPDWRKMQAEFKMEQTHLAPIAALFPDLLSPQGVLTAEIRLQPGGNLSGHVTILDAATGPLPSIGPLRNVQVQIKLAHQNANFFVTGLVGGEPVFIRGQTALNNASWLHGTMPPFQMTLTGTNVTLLRQPRLIVRADLNLGVTNTVGRPVLIAGLVRLRDSLFMQELSDLIGPKLDSPTSRPPFFSISAEPFAQWQLQVKVEGAKFLKARMPVFTGEISANFALSGSLKDPIALGTVQIDTGTVRFPFASLKIQQGQITLASANPHVPNLSITASAQTFGYDVTMSVRGTAEKPIIEFSSTPALTPQQILLMLSTGELPRGGLSLSAQQRVQTIALFLGRSLLSELGFGTGSSNRLIIQSGETLSETGRPTYSIEYRLTADWSILGERDRFNDYNLMLKWKLYSK